MEPPSKFKDALYRFNTKMMHIWFIISDYSPRRIIKRRKRAKAYANYAPTPLIIFDATYYQWWVDTGHADMGPFDSKTEAEMHRDRILSDRKKK